ncbi:S-methyl-5-thioribose-1-phosphate isomerase [Cyclobacteriaceae bacterium]|nr:S-methyl-5-thioribose-1-phosphate isomerase [Cyclobacteriaceae bacterium]MDB4605757.1 S-methyl-5-thioribose-1-phosphate isomerase [Cyclobacteriaceae bacterium]
MTTNSNVIQTMRWVDEKFEMIDQRILPNKFQYVAYYSAKAVADGIKSMVVRGAPAIGCAAAFGIALEAIKLVKERDSEYKSKLEEAFDVLARSRPTAVNLFWALDKMRRCFNENITLSLQDLSKELLDEAIAMMEGDILINKKMGTFGADLLSDGARVLTHCNAGALATAGHGTALGVIRSAVESGKSISVIADETRPFLQGARLTAWEMVQENIPITLISDNMSGHLMARGEIDAIIVGTDRVAANGDVANKIGTYMVAVLAKRHAIPFYVACPISTIDLNCLNGDAIPIEERDGSEVTGYRNIQWAAKGVKVRNPSFDVTPAELVTAIITEKGLIFNPSQINIKKIFKGEEN